MTDNPVIARELPLRQWTDLLNGIETRHRGDLVFVGAPDAPCTAEGALRAFRATPGPEGRFVVALGANAEEFETTTIPCPRRLYVLRDEEGVEQGLLVESAAGMASVIRFADRQHAASGALRGARWPF